MGTANEANSPATGNGYSNGHSVSNGGKEKPRAAGNAKKTQPKSGGSVLGSYMKLRKASRRPLPTDLGDGCYRQVANRPGIGQDLRSLSRDGKKTSFLACWPTLVFLGTNLM